MISKDRIPFAVGTNEELTMTALRALGASTDINMTDHVSALREGLKQMGWMSDMPQPFEWVAEILNGRATRASLAMSHPHTKNHGEEKRKYDVARAALNAAREMQYRVG